MAPIWRGFGWNPTQAYFLGVFCNCLSCLHLCEDLSLMIYFLFFLVIWKIIAMIVIGVTYYPLFACMATDYKITGFVIGLFYSALWLVISITTSFRDENFAI